MLSEKLYAELKWLELLSEIENKYEKWEATLLDSLKKVPEGSLQISSLGTKMTYHHRLNGKRIYISKSNVNFAKELAQKDYYEEALRVVQEQIKRNKYLLGMAPLKTMEEVYEQLSEERKALVDPLFLSNEEYAKRWIAEPFTPKPFDDERNPDAPKYYSAKGLRVRSRIEGLFADKLDYNDIFYKYECPIHLQGYHQPVYPDFTVLNKRTRKIYYWEHFGMMDRKSYVDDNLYRINCYHQNGYIEGKNFICTFESDRKPISMDYIQTLIETYFL